MGAAATTTTPAGTPAATPKKCKDGLAENERQVPWKESNLEPLPLVEEAFGSVKVTDDELESMKPKEKAQMITNILSSLCRRRVANMSPNLGRHCVSLRHRRGPDIPNLYQLLPTSTNQPKHTGTLALAIIEFLCLSSNNDHEITNMWESPTCLQMSCRFGHPADTTFSCVCNMTSESRTQNVAVWATKMTRRHPT